MGLTKRSFIIDALKSFEDCLTQISFLRGTYQWFGLSIALGGTLSLFVLPS